MPTIKIEMPLFVMLPRVTKPARKMIVNLNNYRNWHYIISNEVKTAYTAILKSKLRGFKFERIELLHFVYWKGSNRTSDRSNVLTIHEKFFCDALTHYGCITDDNDKIIKGSHFSGGDLDKENPRVEIYITF